MSVRAKFYVTGIKPTIQEQPNAVSRQITFGAVCRGANNSAWASATPSGSLTMNVRNDHAIAQFEVGQEYYLDFTPAEPKPVTGDGHQIEEGTTPWGSPCCKVCGMVPGYRLKDGSSYEYEWVWDEESTAKHEREYGPKTD